MLRSNDLQPVMPAYDIGTFLQLAWLSVYMSLNRSTSVAFDTYRLHPHSFDKDIFIDKTRKQIDPHKSLDYLIAGMDNRYVNIPVVDSRLRRYIGIIAILRGIAHCHKKRFLRKDRKSVV